MSYLDDLIVKAADAIENHRDADSGFACGPFGNPDHPCTAPAIPELVEPMLKAIMALRGSEKKQSNDR